MFKRLAVLLIGALLLFGLTACDSIKSMTSNVTVGKVIEEFKAAGLEAENPSDLPEKEFGNTRKEAKRILVPALGEDSGGRIFEFKNKEDLEKAKKYYDDLGNGNQMLFSHTYAKGNFLIQMNGDMEDAQFNNYKEVMDKVIN
ncbi:stress protein [Bacillus toyonensis]|uniref:Stress protein n=1 Tax=Bacillus toyonensis TaxID=155322 RepID=A0AB73S7Z1_9BACI|nr:MULTISPECIES: stress protein [Bacillus]MBC2686426.1 stress protein [Bacillus toyonensis]MBH0358340.1 stress protein [Bacillus toyonensis biovar Thuringiensis]MBJ8067818.1 stress protein [Bacillus cereus group sp. N15]MCS3599177.1 Sec-independent protein translocase protein TatA [Bacillus sp. JUb91]PEI84479.1 stress protein [Bacillus toyonensis]